MNNPTSHTSVRVSAAIQMNGDKPGPMTDRDQHAYTLGTDEDSERSLQEEVCEIRREYEDQIRRQREQYQRVIRELDAFSYSVAHDLKAPLRAVASLVERLTEQQGNGSAPECSHTIEAIKDSTAMMQNLVESLLRFSRTNDIQQNLVEVDMTSLVRGVLDEILRFESGASLTVSLDPLHPAVADGVLIRQVWVNLLSNALKYSRKKSPRQISINSRSAAGEIIYSVSDNGVGFNMQYAGKLFGVFQRLHSSEEFEGTGVGLAIVQRIIHKHGGRVWAEGIEDHGATFYFALPQAHDSGRPTRN